MSRNPSSARLPLRLCLALMTLSFPATSRADGDGPGKVDSRRPGEGIYREGVLSSGAPLIGMAAQDVQLRGIHASCAKCHRWSGFGSIEAGKFTPPITGPSLFQARQPERANLFRSLYQEPQPEAEYARARIPRIRPAYNDRTLAAAIRTGVDPAGRTLGTLMPRYDLSDEDMGPLLAYLKGLGAGGTPGVNDQEVHFATVVGSDIPPAARDAMLQVIEAFVAEKNLETRRYLSRPGVSPNYKSELLRVYRRWIIHTWVLDGPRETYAKQLERLYAEQPVFALVSGIAGGSWRPIHDFCERHELPCLFPNTDLPMAAADGGYTLYLSRGLYGEAAVLSAFLQRDQGQAAGRRVAQAYRARTAGAEAAEAFGRAMRRVPCTVRELVVKDGRDLNGLIRSDPGISSSDALVLWLDESDLRAADLAETMRIMGNQEVFIPAGTVDQPAESFAEWLPGGVSLLSPFEMPERRVPQLYRVRSWMSSRRITPEHEAIRLNTHFALSVTAHAMWQMVDHFSRDYLIERIEHETENALNPGVFPRLSLGPGQRYASKGGYVIHISQDDEKRLVPRGEWINR